MDFIKTFQNNPGIRERVLAFSPQLPQHEKGGGHGITMPSFPPAVELLDNGDIILRYVGEGVREVSVTVGNEKEVILTDNGFGVFEGRLMFDPAFAGPHTVSYTVNGIEVLNPFCPIWFGNDRAVNYIEIPDEEIADLISLHADVPRGSLSQEIFYSETVGSYARCLVYTPPGYEKGGDYPCLYIQHGATENETSWAFNGKLPYILNNLIATGKAVPFIVVMNDGMILAPGEDPHDDFIGFEAIVTKDCREYIESHYRVRTDKWSRALAGLSRGSVQTSVVGMTHPELYGYLGLFSGFLRKITRSDYELNSHLDAIRNPDKFLKDYRIFFRSIGEQENKTQLGRFTDDDEFLRQYGIFDSPVHIRKMYPNMRHEWGCWRRALIDFAQLIFR